VQTDDPPEVVAAARDPRKHVGRYVLLAELGKGGMGVVYRAWDTSLRRQVALKMVLDPAHAGVDGIKRFHAEAQAVAKLQHPGIVSIHEIGEHQGRPFISMELVQGESLEKNLKRSKVDARRAAELGREIALALEHAHQHGIVHRDVKPENVILDENGRTRLMDFGLAQDTARSERLTVTGAALGTPAYMAPEQAGERKLQGPRSDLYSLGALMYRAVAGHPPFQGDSLAEIMKKVILDAPRPLRQLDASIPAAFDAVVLRCLEKEPDKRYPSAAALAQDLESFLATGKVAARAPVRASGVRAVSRSSARVPVPAVEPAAAKKKPPVALIGGGVVLGVVALVFFLARGPGGASTAALDLTITSPAETSKEKPLLLASATLQLDGKLSDPAAGPLHVLEDGNEAHEVKLSPDGTFSERLALASATRTLDVAAGTPPREARKTIHVEIDSEPPGVTLEKHESVRPGETVEAIALVRGRHPGAAVRFVVKQGQEEPERRDVPRDGKQARFSFEVSRGVEKIRVRAEVTDELGRPASDEVVIDVKAPEPEVVVAPPPPPPPPPPAPAPAPPPAPQTPEALELKLTLDPVASPTNAASVEVHGHVDPPADGTVEIKLDDADARTFDVAHGEVKAQVPLATEGLHVVRVRVHAAGAIELTDELRVTVDRKPPDVKVENLTKPDAGDTSVAVTITPSKPVRSLKANGKELVTGTPSAGPFELDLDVPATGDPKVEVVALDVAGNERKLAPKTFPRPPKGTPDTTWEKGLKLPEHVRRGKERPVYVYAPPSGKKKKLEIELVYVAPPAEKKETGFFVGRTPVTWKQYRAFCALAGVDEPPAPKHDGSPDDADTPGGEYEPTDDRPVTMVDFAQAERFAQWAGLRLPTDKEWAKTAGCEEGRKYPWGDDPPRSELCWSREECKSGLAPPVVGAHLKGASPYGALDLLGCVWEWTSDTTHDGKAHFIKGMPFIFPRDRISSPGGGVWSGLDWRVGFRVALDPPNAKAGK
jgi:predicted Ser/Thr protein kinase